MPQFPPTTKSHATSERALSTLLAGQRYVAALPSALSDAGLHAIGRDLLPYESFARGYAVGTDGESHAETRPKALMEHIVGDRGDLTLDEARNCVNRNAASLLHAYQTVLEREIVIRSLELKYKNKNNTDAFLQIVDQTIRRAGLCRGLLSPRLF
ncbi:MAG: hypothetical protein ABI702_15845 [Burkholderiales bacterium]